jgi:hypothetical protein
MNNIKLKASRLVIVLPLWVLAQCALERPGHAQDRPDNAASQNETAPASPASAGLLPIPNYSADFWTRGQLSGDRSW